MKQIFKMLLLVIIATISTATAVNAQTRQQRMTREELATVQAKHIAGELSLDEATANKFVDTYCNFQRELWALDPRPGRNGSGTVADRFDHSQKILDLRKKYYAEYSKFLTEVQIEKVYEIEHKMMKRLARKHSRRNR